MGKTIEQEKRVSKIKGFLGFKIKVVKNSRVKKYLEDFDNSVIVNNYWFL